jgi:hypothetical protein
MSETLKELRALSLDELIARHDRSAQSTSGGVLFYLQEIARRDSARQADEMLRMTRAITRLTYVIAILTAVMAVVVIVGR